MDGSQAIQLTAEQIAGKLEPLGHNCEVGLVQRDFGHEPDWCLFRWAHTPLDALTAAARDRFSQIGRDELDVFANEESDEWQARSCGITWHSHVRANLPREQAIAQMNRSLPRLTSVMLERIAGGERIFTYASPELRAIGPALLLVVTPGDRSLVTWGGDGLLAATLPNLTSRRGAWARNRDDWGWLLGEIQRSGVADHLLNDPNGVS